MKVSLTVDVPVKEWADEYGIDPHEVREDVRRYLRDAFESHLQALGIWRSS